MDAIKILEKYLGDNGCDGFINTEFEGEECFCEKGEVAVDCKGATEFCFPAYQAHGKNNYDGWLIGPHPDFKKKKQGNRHNIHK